MNLIEARAKAVKGEIRAEAALNWYINDEGECDIEALDECKQAIQKARAK